MPVTLNDDQVANIKAELEQAKRDRLVREGAEAIWNDPELSDAAKALWKKKFPEAQIQDYDLKRQIFDRLDSEKAAREKEVNDAAEAREVNRFQSQRSDVQKRHSLTDDAMERMEKMMNERKVYDYEVAADHFVAREPKPIESTTRSHLWNHDRGETFKQISADPEEWGMNEIMKTLNDTERRNRS